MFLTLRTILSSARDSSERIASSSSSDVQLLGMSTCLSVTGGFCPSDNTSMTQNGKMSKGRKHSGMAGIVKRPQFYPPDDDRLKDWISLYVVDISLYSIHSHGILNHSAMNQWFDYHG